jgi:hypothetical protein
MNRIIYVMMVFLLTIACQKGSGDNIPGAYSIQQGSIKEDKIKYYGPYENFSLLLNSNTKSGKYAILYRATIDGVQKVGIAVSDDPNSTTSFNLKIYFDASEVPTAPKSINDADVIIKVSDGSTLYTYTRDTSPGVTISFEKTNPVPAVPEPDYSYINIFKITFSGPINVAGANLDISTINALDLNQ